MVESLKENEIFVFGSNLGGIHAAGAAKQASNDFGAETGVGEGLTGQSYAFPTLDSKFNKRGGEELAVSRDRLYEVVRANPEKNFLLTKVGCGIAGYEEEYMKELFTEPPTNLILPKDWGPQADQHRHYGKIHRLGKDETEGILDGLCVVQEKIDGANTSIWVGPDGKLWMGSRTRILRDNEEFNGFVPYVKAHEGINALLTLHPNYRLYGEWLVRHTVAYRETAYRKFYLFDIWDGTKYLTAADVQVLAEEFNIPAVPVYGVFENPTADAIKALAGNSAFGDRGEGIVIKNLDFKNKFGDCVFAKIVTNAFMEDNAVAFGGNNKFSKTYFELWAVNKYMTLPRVKKVMDKTQPEIDKKLDMEHIPRICNTAFHDLVQEEMWDIIQKVPAMDFKDFRRLAFKKAKQIYIDILNDDINIHDAVQGG